MWKRYFVAAVAVLGCAAASCGGYSTPPDPVVPAPKPVDAVVIDVVGINGAQSFSPNPSSVAAGHAVVWHNVDTVVHRVVFNDGEVDTGNIAPGAFSVAMPLVAPGPYHCSIHPEMVGTIKSP